MGSQATPVLRNWETQIDNQIKVSKLCFSTGDFSLNSALVANELMSNVDHVAIFREVHVAIEGASDPINILNELNINSIISGKSTFEDFKSRIETLKQEQPDKEAWEQTINNAAAEAKQTCVETIDKAANAAKDIIRQLHEDERQPGADIFSKGLKYAMFFFKKVWDAFLAVAQALWDFLRGVWKKLEESWNTIKSWANTAINWIGGSFSILSVEATWPSGHTIDKITAEVGKMIAGLMDQGIRVKDYFMKQRSNGWTFETSLSPGENAGPHVDIGDIWKDAIKVYTSATVVV